MPRMTRGKMLIEEIQKADVSATSGSESCWRARTNEEVDLFLTSPDPNLRIIAYMQLQTRPDPSRLSGLADCFFLEGFLASREKETRPLWQLLVAIGQVYQRVPPSLTMLPKVKLL